MAHANAPSSFAVFPRRAASPVFDVDSPFYQKVAGTDRDRKKSPLHSLWHRRWSTKANGVSYPVQRAAEALYSAEGREQVRGLIDHYMGNARILRDAAIARACEYMVAQMRPIFGWKRRPVKRAGKCSTRMLQELNVVITPGSGFGSRGEGFFRISAFNSRSNAEKSPAVYAKRGLSRDQVLAADKSENLLTQETGEESKSGSQELRKQTERTCMFLGFLASRFL